MQGDVNLKQPDVKLWVIIINTENNYGLPQEVRLHLSMQAALLPEYRETDEVNTPAHTPAHSQDSCAGAV